tara:strand:+ start:2673 stop:2807 length:135 start_codon:yes stop_codon:yes gene_type:complete
MAITRGQMTKQIDGQLSGARINKKHRKKVKKVLNGRFKKTKKMR